MSRGIKESFERKGYLTLADNGVSGIAIRPNINEPARRLMNKVWFDTGLKMTDGKTARTIAATSEAEVEEFRKKPGFREVSLQQAVSAPGADASEVESFSQAEAEPDASQVAQDAGAGVANEAEKNLFDAGDSGDDARQGGNKSAGTTRKKNP